MKPPVYEPDERSVQRSQPGPAVAKWLSAVARLLTKVAAIALLSNAVADDGGTYVFVCDDQASYVVRVAGTEAWVFLPEETLRLAAVPSTDETRYTDGNFEILVSGQQARLGPAGGELLSCRNDPRRAVWERAKLDGVDFRAVGNEPGWYLEIRAQERLVLVADYGTSRVEAPLPEPSVDRETQTTRWDAGELVVQVVGRPCVDTMSGERFPTEVTVHWGKRVLHGCGRALH